MGRERETEREGEEWMEGERGEEEREEEMREEEMREGERRVAEEDMRKL